MARLDRLAAVKALAQLGATLGCEFPYTLLQAVSLWDEETLGRGLHLLVDAEFLYQQGLPPEATYRFKTRPDPGNRLSVPAAGVPASSITSALPRCWRRAFPDRCETQPELLAHHYTEAGSNGPSRSLLAAAPASGLSSVRPILEAVAHLTQGLELLATLPETPERAQQELDLQTTLGPALMFTKGQAAPEVLHAYARARALCQQMGETPQLFQVLRGVWLLLPPCGWSYGRRRSALGEQLLTLGQQVGCPRAPPGGPLLPLGLPLNYLGRVYRGPGPFRAGDRPLRPPAAPCPCRPLRAGPRSGWPRPTPP